MFINYSKSICIYNNFCITCSQMYFSLPKKNYSKKYRMILDESLQFSNSGIDILNDVLLSLALLMTMTSFLFATVNSSHGNGYWEFLLYPNQSQKMSFIIWIKILALFLILQNVAMKPAKDLYIRIWCKDWYQDNQEDHWECKDLEY